ncbi:MAG: ATP-binding cassette domain-containing protein [Candidatus Dormibacteraeota bacterium]|nr:ATP-binding cassette domain-containing protein [Candidatus Dormibacteraeota bacterium]MBV9525017.1 ATP-binding cassette domain-containing protein [Candidatus Dormibacteraeota bacterium]
MAEGPPALELDSVSVRRSGRTIWHDASVAVAPGTFTAVVGPNGAGKTTLLKLLLGLMEPASGSVRVLGEPPRRGNPRIGYVPQRRSLDVDVPVRGVDLVGLGVDGHRWGFQVPGARRHDHRVRVNRALDEVGARPLSRRRVGRLSGGEQQRVLLAQALAGDPDLLLLDEPLASLDVRNQVVMAHLVNRVVRERGVSALMVTHDINPILGVIDAVVYIAQERVVAGAPSEIVSTPTLSAIYGAQVEVLRDSHGHVFVVGLDQEAAHPHDH